MIWKEGYRKEEGVEQCDVAARLKGFGGLADKGLPQATGPKPGLRHLLPVCVCVCVAWKDQEALQRSSNPHLFTCAFPPCQGLWPEETSRTSDEAFLGSAATQLSSYTIDQSLFVGAHTEQSFLLLWSRVGNYFFFFLLHFHKICSGLHCPIFVGAK